MTKQKIILVAVNSMHESFELSLSSEENLDNVVYILTDNLSDWNEEPDLFDNKSFGDRESGIFVNFLYKKGDKQFDSENLANEILKFKQILFLKNL